ncbi:hypothetical protein K32_08500 [Kaistia sp. 32K]|uniref:hypothetical protein n=1 Tax=Kaistia sp. 32K TaxID=2795690 RepID=UPI0019156D40|nr:hypothetical protein [Kaistia sp. 32K]BCP52233.1 hypothetical protein K32_08500 [Kaistia sp. 32K]
MNSAKQNVLAVGVYLADVENTNEHIRAVFAGARTLNVTQRWTAITLNSNARIVSARDAVVRRRTARFTLINRMLRDFQNFDWIVVTDDDVELAPGFLDDLIAVAVRADFALFQPARTRDSFIDHRITAQCDGTIARQTNFVEIGPMVCLRADAAKLLIPFDETTEMAWGLDYIWPVIIRDAGLKMGIIDASPAAHRIRPPNTTYNGNHARSQSKILLTNHRHLASEDAFRVLDVVV